MSARPSFHRPGLARAGCTDRRAGMNTSLASMTGFARTEGNAAGLTWVLKGYQLFQGTMVLCYAIALLVSLMVGYTLLLYFQGRNAPAATRLRRSPCTSRGSAPAWTVHRGGTGRPARGCT